MRCSLDKVLLDARQLANRIRATDETADMLIKQASDAHNKIVSKKQCQEEVLSFEELSTVVKERPRSRLMMCIAAENKQLELLRQENKVLRTSLTEYETTLEMIINKFRKHKNMLKKLDQLENGDFKNPQLSLNLSSATSNYNSPLTSGNRIITLCSKVTQLKCAIEQALTADNKVTHDLTEIETKLTLENTELRRLLDISREFQNGLPERIDLPNSNQSIIIINQKKKQQQQQQQQRIELTTVVNGVTKERKSNNKMINSINLSTINKKSIIASKMINNHSSLPTLLTTNHLSEMEEDEGEDSHRAASADLSDDDHSSVASDASVKTLI